MIARNEESCIGRAIASIAPEVDEVIVVDTGSTDNTVETAKAAGARVESFAWCDDFSAARNASLAVAREQWIITLDCDEQLVVETPGLLRRALANHPADAAVIRMVDCRDGKPAGAVWNAVRAVRRIPGTRFRGRIHERLDLPEGCTQAPLDKPLPGLYVAHHGYDLTARQAREKAQRNRRLIELTLSDLAAGETDDRNLLLFYRAFGATADERPALLAEWVHDIDRQPQLLGTPTRNWVAAGLAQYASWLMDHQRIQEARGRAEQAMRHFGPHPTVSLVLARAAAASGSYGEAEGYLSDVTSTEAPAAASYQGFPFDAPRVCRRGMALLAEIRERFGKLAEARAIYASLAAAEPEYLPVVLRLLCVLVQMEEYEAAMDVLRRNPRLTEQDLPEIDCLGLALALVSKSPERDQWVQRISPWIDQNPLAERVWHQALAAPASREFGMQDFPELAQGVRSNLP